MRKFVTHVIFGIGSTALVTTHIAIRIGAAAILTVIALGPPVAITWFPQLFEIVSVRIYRLGEGYWSIAGNASFLAVISALGVAPYFFGKIADSMLSAIRAIGREYRSIATAGWGYVDAPNGGIIGTAELISQRFSGLIWIDLSSLSSNFRRCLPLFFQFIIMMGPVEFVGERPANGGRRWATPWRCPGAAPMARGARAGPKDSSTNSAGRSGSAAAGGSGRGRRWNDGGSL